MKKIPNRTILRTLFKESVYFDAIDVINYLNSEPDIEKIIHRLVELNDSIAEENGVFITRPKDKND